MGISKEWSSGSIYNSVKKLIKTLFKLASATIVGQIATLILMSVLFKLGFKNEIANFALLVTFLAIITPISTLRLDIAFIVDMDRKSITNYVAIAILFSSLIIVPVLIFWGETFSSEFIKDTQIVPIFSILIMCNMGVLFCQAYWNRSGKFDKLFYIVCYSTAHSMRNSDCVGLL